MRFSIKLIEVAYVKNKAFFSTEDRESKMGNMVGIMDNVFAVSEGSVKSSGALIHTPAALYNVLLSPSVSRVQYYSARTSVSFQQL